MGGAPGRTSGALDRRPQRSFRADTKAATSPCRRRLGLDTDGHIAGLRVTAFANLGASTVNFAPLQNYERIATSVYDIPVCARTRLRRAHQHRADGSVSRRRPARSDVRDRTAARHRGRALGLDRLEIRGAT